MEVNLLISNQRDKVKASILPKDTSINKISSLIYFIGDIKEQIIDLVLTLDYFGSIEPTAIYVPS
jgi:hypothetical protein